MSTDVGLGGHGQTGSRDCFTVSGRQLRVVDERPASATLVTSLEAEEYISGIIHGGNDNATIVDREQTGTQEDEDVTIQGNRDNGSRKYPENGARVLGRTGFLAWESWCVRK